MWSARVRLISSIIAASVVDLPEPVGPVTSTRPRGFSASSCSDVGQAELLERLDLVRDQAERGAERLALEEDVDAEARDARDRVREVDLAVDLEPLLLLGREDAVEQVARLLGVSGGTPSRRCRWPRMRTTGGEPTVMCRSEAFSCTICLSSCRSSDGCIRHSSALSARPCADLRDSSEDCSCTERDADWRAASHAPSDADPPEWGKERCARTVDTCPATNCTDALGRSRTTC